jgi:putative ABC transport system ATP-binding protein
VTSPSLLLADEPTGNLDTTTGEEILALFDAIHRAGNSVIVVTHDAGIAARASRVLRMLDGRIEGDTQASGDPS